MHLVMTCCKCSYNLWYIWLIKWKFVNIFLHYLNFQGIKWYTPKFIQFWPLTSKNEVKMTLNQNRAKRFGFSMLENHHIQFFQNVYKNSHPDRFLQILSWLYEKTRLKHCFLQYKSIKFFQKIAYISSILVKHHQINIYNDGH